MRISRQEPPTMPSDSEHRDRRQRALMSLLRRRRVTSQRQLVELLGREGVAATQSSVSRDLRDLAVVKVGGRYAAPASGREPLGGALEEAVAFVRGVRRAGPHLTVVLTAVGAAQAVAVALDRAGWPEVVGTLAGDDAIFVASGGSLQQRRLIQRLEAARAAAAGAGEAGGGAP
jgi:transcriptional regulator of arginine metabolism